MTLPYQQQPGVAPGVEHVRAAMIPPAIDTTKLPKFFPTAQYALQAQRYMEYWTWFRGYNLANEETAQGASKFPLRINTVKNFSRKHAAVLLGEDNFDLAQPLIKTLVTPKLPLDGETPDEASKKRARTFQNIINEVWLSSGGRSLQVENAIVSQFLGGCVFQLKWEPWRDDLLIPITIHAPTPDFVLPVWSGSDYWRLLEAYVLYKIPGVVAEREYGVEMPGHSTDFAYYMEYWTRKTYSVYINGKPLTQQRGGETVVMENLPNPFGEVPLVYIPHLKEGENYGPSIVDDIRGLVLEYNSRMADAGDIVRNNARQNLFAYNLANSLKRRQFGESGPMVNDMGQENPAWKNPPNVTSVDPPSTSPGVMEFPEKLWEQMEREAHMSGIAFGEDEGSQRSGLTLAFRMYPSTSHAMMERALWTEGLRRIASLIGKIVYAKREFLKSRGLTVDLPEHFEREFQITQDWKPMIPRDREQEVNEVVLLTQSNNMSRRTAIQKLGTVRDVDEEWNQILAEQTLLAEILGNSEDDDGADSEDNNPQAEFVTDD